MDTKARFQIATVLTLALAAGAALGEDAARRPGPDPGSIRLKAAEFDPLESVPRLAGPSDIAKHAAGVRGGYLVQFVGPIGEAQLDALKGAGASIKGYVPMMTLEVVMTETVREAVEAIPGVRWVGIHQPSYKLSASLTKVLGEGKRRAELIDLQVGLFPDEDEPALTQIRGLGAKVTQVDRGRSFLMAFVTLPRGRIESLVRIPQVRFVEEVYEFQALNDRSRVLTGLDEIANNTFTAGIDPSLDGKDEASGFQIKYGHFDTGMQTLKADFVTPDVTAEPGSDISDLDNGHGTHTAGSLVGDGGDWATVPESPPASGAVAPDQFRGVTPQAALHHISFDNGYTDRQIFERESEVGAQISSNSWSYSSGGQSIRNYNSNSAVWDEGVWDADNDAPGLQPLVVFFSAGNGGGFNSPYNGCISNGGDNVGTPGNAKNVITVGNNETDRGAGGACGSFSGLGDNPEEMNASSSRGPVDPDVSGQGLFKPDVTNLGGYWVMSVEATGTASACDTQFVLPDCPTYCSNTGPLYAYQNGTSMSCPLTAGLGGVVYQDLVVNRGLSQPKPSLIKALLVNGARDLQPLACNYTFDVTQSVIHEGWGFVQAQESIYGPGGSPTDRKIDFENEESANAVATSGFYTRVIDVAAGVPLKITLAWTDYPAAPLSGSPLVVNDLDLEVTGPDGTFLGNNFIGNWSVSGPGFADRYNVVENVYIQNPQGGSYTITVHGFQITRDQEPDKAGVNQDFSLAWSGDLAGSAQCGNLTCEPSEDSCSCETDCGAPLPTEVFCGDGLDDDCDGGIDCADPDCFDDQVCTGSCGDNICSDSEDCDSCPGDCVGLRQECGNGLCEIAHGENCENCPEDCNELSNGPPSGRFCCGIGTTCATEPRCSLDGFECSEVPTVPYCCGDTVCEGAEDPANCPVDCTVASGAVPPIHGASETPLIVTRSGGNVVLSWDASCRATDDDYAVYEGSLGDFASHVPRFCGTSGLTQVSFTTPTEDVYFLVVPHNVNREGSYGQSEPPIERPASLSACLLQELATCP